MKKTIFLLIAAAWTAAAAGPNPITWSASYGSDANPCTRKEPCRSAARAIEVTKPGGIVHLADSADYGSIIISDPVTIDGAGEGAVLQGHDVLPIPIHIVGSLNGGVINLRNLVLYPAIPGSQERFEPDVYGLSIEPYDSVTVNLDNVVIQSPVGVTTVSGILAGNANMNMRNVRVIGGKYGMIVPAANIVPTVTMDRVSISNALSAAFSGVDFTGSITDSAFSSTAKGYGVQITRATKTASVMLERTQITGNQTGLLVFGISATASISECVITGNATGLSTSNAGSILTYRTNRIMGNGVDGSASQSVAMQ